MFKPNRRTNKLYLYRCFTHSKRKIKKILKKIMSLNYVVSYYNNNNMLYIFSENLVFGVDLNICEFIGLSKDKIIDKVNTLSDVTLLQNEIFNKCKDLIKNNREKIIPYIYYNGTNNENSNLEASFVIEDKVDSFKKYINNRFKIPIKNIFEYTSPQLKKVKKY